MVGEVAVTLISGAAAGALISGTLTHHFTRKRERLRAQAELSAAACADFVRGMTALAAAARRNDTAMRERNLDLIVDAKTRIMLYGRNKTARALADFQRGSGGVISPTTLPLFLNFCQSARDEHVADGKQIDSEDLAWILFGQQFLERASAENPP